MIVRHFTRRLLTVSFEHWSIKTTKFIWIWFWELIEIFCLGDIEITKMLIENGAEVNAKDENDRTPLHWAAENGKEHCYQSVDIAILIMIN